MHTKLFSKKESFKGIAITFSFIGVYQLLNSSIIRFTNRIVKMEEVFGDKADLLLSSITKAKTNNDRVHILNSFFKLLLETKKKYRSLIV